MPLPEPSNWQLQVAHVSDVTPLMRRIVFTNPLLSSFAYAPGQDVSLAFTNHEGVTVRRRYTIRGFDRERRLLEINVVMHGDGPGMRWAQMAKPGSPIEAIAPRGKITLAEGADWHLFAGDASAVPASLAMMEALDDSVPAIALLEVDGPDERQLPTKNGLSHTIEWCYGSAEAPSANLVTALNRLAIPAGRGHAYLAGEVSLVMALKQSLISRGLQPDQISAKAYWNRGKPNAERGEPEQRAS